MRTQSPRPRAITGVVSLACLLVIGCAQTPLQREDLAQIKRIGVVSVVGDAFTRRYVGITVFGNESDERDVSVWKIDQAYEEQLGNAAATIFGAAYVPAKYSRDSFSVVNHPRGLQGPRGPTWSKIEEAAREYCRANALDTLLVVVQGSPTIPGTQIQLDAVGIVSRITWASLYVGAQVAVIDCGTGKPRKVQVLSEEDGVFVMPYVSASLPKEVGAIPVTRWDPSLEVEMREKTLKLPAQAWATTIKRMMERSP